MVYLVFILLVVFILVMYKLYNVYKSSYDYRKLKNSLTINEYETYSSDECAKNYIIEQLSKYNYKIEKVHQLTNNIEVNVRTVKVVFNDRQKKKHELVYSYFSDNREVC